MKIVEDFMRRVQPVDYYEIDQATMQQKAKLIYAIIDHSKIEPHKIMTITLKLTSDHNNC